VDNARANFLICRSENSPVNGSAGLLAVLSAIRHNAAQDAPTKEGTRFSRFFETGAGLDPYLACEKSKCPLPEHSLAFAAHRTIQFTVRFGEGTAGFKEKTSIEGVKRSNRL